MDRQTNVNAQYMPLTRWLADTPSRFGGQSYYLREIRQTARMSQHSYMQFPLLLRSMLCISATNAVVRSQVLCTIFASSIISLNALVGIGSLHGEISQYRHISESASSWRAGTSEGTWLLIPFSVWYIGTFISGRENFFISLCCQRSISQPDVIFCILRVGHG